MNLSLTYATTAVAKHGDRQRVIDYVNRVKCASHVSRACFIATTVRISPSDKRKSLLAVSSVDDTASRIGDHFAKEEGRRKGTE